MPIQKWSERIWVTRLSADPALTDDIEALCRLMGRGDAPDDTPPDQVIDLSGVQHLNSSHLSRLLRLRKGAIERGVRLRLVAPSDQIWALFLATGLDKVFEFAPDTPTALAELQIDK